MTQFTIMTRKKVTGGPMMYRSRTGMAERMERSMPVQPKWNVAFVASFPGRKRSRRWKLRDTYKEQNSSTWKEKRQKRQCIWKRGGWGYFWEDRACLSLRFLGHGLVVSTVVSLDLSAGCGALFTAASLSALPSFGSHYVLHFLAL